MDLVISYADLQRSWKQRSEDQPTTAAETAILRFSMLS